MHIRVCYRYGLDAEVKLYLGVAEKELYDCFNKPCVWRIE